MEVIRIPTKCGQTDSKGTFCRWGGKGKKYYYTPGDKASMARARKKADKQGRAIQVNKSIEDILLSLRNIQDGLNASKE